MSAVFLIDCSSAPPGPCAWYRDADGDGYGDPAISIDRCEDLAGYVANDSDCDDNNDAIHPDTVWYLDEDLDGYGVSTVSKVQCEPPAGYARVAGDCDDADGTLQPGTVWGYDRDGDGYGDPATTVVGCAPPAGYVLGASDCNDTDANEHPGQTWHLDFDHDGSGHPGVTTTACQRPVDYVLDGRDCDDQDSTVHVGVGSCPYRPPGATSCLNILDSGHSEGDGAYAINPGGAGSGTAFTVFCDMTTDGGGWTALLNPGGYKFATPTIPNLSLSGEYTGGTNESCGPPTPVITGAVNGGFGIAEYACGDRSVRYHTHWTNPLGARDVRFVATAQGMNGALRINGAAIAASRSLTNTDGMVCRFWNGTGSTPTFPAGQGLNSCIGQYPDFAPRVQAASFTGQLDLDIEVGPACAPNCAYGVGMNLYKLFVR